MREGHCSQEREAPLLNPWAMHCRMWIWTGIAFMWGWLVLYSFLGALALSFTNPPTPQPTGKRLLGPSMLTY